MILAQALESKKTESKKTKRNHLKFIIFLLISFQTQFVLLFGWSRQYKLLISLVKAVWYVQLKILKIDDSKLHVKYKYNKERIAS